MENNQDPGPYRSELYRSNYRSDYRSQYDHATDGFQEVHLSDYIFVLKRYKWIAILTFLSVITAVALYSFNATPIYKSTVQLFIEPPSFSIAGAAADGKYRNPTDKKQYLQTQLQLLKSKAIVERVLDQETTQDFIGKIRPEETTAIEQNLNEKPIAEKSSWFKELTSKLQIGQANIKPEGSKNGENPKHQLDRMSEAAEYLSNLRITPIKDSGLVDVSIFDPSPEKATRLANTHADIFIAKNIEALGIQNQKNLEWLDEQIAAQKTKLEASQEALYDYQKTQQIMSLGKSSDINSQELMQLNSALIKARADREVKENAYNQLRQVSLLNKQLYSYPAVAQDQQILNLRARYMQLLEQRSFMKVEYGPSHQKMIELQKKVSYVAGQLKNEINRVKGFLKKELDLAISLEKSAKSALDEHKGSTMVLQEKAFKYDYLKRAVDSDQAVFDSLLSRSKQFDLIRAFKSDNISIVKRADIPIRPAKPKILQNILLAAIAGLFLGCGLAFFMDYMDTSVKTPTDVRRYLDLPVIGVLPFDKAVSKNSSPSLPSETNDIALINSYKYPFLRVLDWLPSDQTQRVDTGGSVLLMESAKMGEGKTTICGNMALHFGKSGYRVLVADCDFQRPAAHRLFGEQNNYGFTDTMKEILALDINSGNLNELSISDLYSVIGLRKLSGRLKVINDDQSIISEFRNGRLSDIISENTPYQSRIGSMLVQEGFLSKSQYSAILARNMRTGQPFGYIVVNSGHVTQNQLQGLLKLQCEEHLHKLFSWKRGTFNFDQQQIDFHESEKIKFDEDYTEIIAKLSRTSGNRKLEESIFSKIRETGRKNVDIICTGPIEDTYGDPVNTQLLDKLIDILKQRYDIILMDAPPVLDAADSVTLARIADHIVFIIKAGYQPYPALQEAVSRLMDKEDNPVISGVVLNMVKNINVT